mmetsp:Transcript_26443/g.49143  ORF Transcript_26443/g.49143 Transcript_26443/m.49143 type:complete len:217 (+) Transcript_26443:125-775(+)
MSPVLQATASVLDLVVADCIDRTLVGTSVALGYLVGCPVGHLAGLPAAHHAGLLVGLPAGRTCRAEPASGHPGLAAVGRIVAFGPDLDLALDPDPAGCTCLAGYSQTLAGLVDSSAAVDSAADHSQPERCQHHIGNFEFAATGCPAAVHTFPAADLAAGRSPAGLVAGPVADHTFLAAWVAVGCILAVLVGTAAAADFAAAWEAVAGCADHHTVAS